MRNDKKNLIVELTFKFSLDVIEFVDVLEQRRKFVFANQIVKSGTSVGANVREAQNAESRTDFTHKFKIAAKEADETRYWLELCKESKLYPNPPQELFDSLESINKVILKIISSSKR